jgi:hypothetical protein
MDDDAWRADADAAVAAAEDGGDDGDAYGGGGEEDAERESQEFWQDVSAAAQPHAPACAAAAAAAYGAPSAAAQHARPAGQCDTVYTNAKSGMGGVDAEHVRRVVYEMSKDSECVLARGALPPLFGRPRVVSPRVARFRVLTRRVCAFWCCVLALHSYFKEARRRDAATDARCDALRARAATLTAPQFAASARTVAAKTRALDAERDLSRTWLCVDMDAFFASVEIRDAPHLAHVPMARTQNTICIHAHARSLMRLFRTLPGCWWHVHDHDEQLRGAQVGRARRDAGLHRETAVPRARVCGALFRKIHRRSRGDAARVCYIRSGVHRGLVR